MIAAACLFGLGVSVGFVGAVGVGLWVRTDGAAGWASLAAWTAGAGILGAASAVVGGLVLQRRAVARVAHAQGSGRGGQR